MTDINNAIVATVKTGKTLFGVGNALRNVKIGKAKLVIIASNCRKRTRRDIAYYCELSNIPIITFEGTSIDLGALCGKPFMISAVTVWEPGDSDILKLVEAENV